MTVEVEEIPFAGLRDNIDRNFRHVAESKNLPFHVQFAADLPPFMASDPKRLQQILKNLLSNAVKFTAHGHVDVRVGLGRAGLEPRSPGPRQAAQVVAFAVEDTGIGVAPEKQRLIFEAFQQADAGTSRKYGGTGLGLAISRELAALLGGEIRLASVHGQGQHFHPLPAAALHRARDSRDAGRRPMPRADRSRSHACCLWPAKSISRTTAMIIEEGDPVLLIIEDDPHYARILLGLARDKGFKGIVATKGATGLSLARQFQPDRHLAGYLPARHARLDGAQQAQTRSGHAAHSGADRHAWKRSASMDSPTGLLLSRQGADDRRPGSGVRPHQRTSPHRAPSDCLSSRTTKSSGSPSSNCSATRTSSWRRSPPAARRWRRCSEPFDCVVLDLRLPDMTGFELWRRSTRTRRFANVPVVVFTGKELTAEEQTQLKAMAKSIVLKDVQSPERLLDETALFLHRVVTDLPREKQEMLERLHGSNEVLRGPKVLVVDDDARNIFALTSLLENHEMDVISATNGRQAIDLLKVTPDGSRPHGRHRVGRRRAGSAT